MEMSVVAINEVAIDGCGVGPECLICAPFLFVEGNVMGKKGGRAGIQKNYEEHMRAASLTGGTDEKCFFFFIANYYAFIDIVPN